MWSVEAKVRGLVAGSCKMHKIRFHTELRRVSRLSRYAQMFGESDFLRGRENVSAEISEMTRYLRLRHDGFWSCYPNFMRWWEESDIFPRSGIFNAAREVQYCSDLFKSF